MYFFYLTAKKNYAKKNLNTSALSFTFSTVPDLMLLHCKGMSHIKQNKSKVCIAINHGLVKKKAKNKQSQRSQTGPSSLIF